MPAGVTLVLMVGGGGRSAVEQAVLSARRAAALDLLDAAMESGVVDRAILATDDPSWVGGLATRPDVEVDVDPAGEPFHLGRRLAGLIRRHRCEIVLYAGGGSAPLMTPADWATALTDLLSQECALVTNNLHSSDWVAFRVDGELLPLISRQDRDNGLAWALTYEGGLAARALPARASTRFDLDTPTDLLIARAHPATPARLRAALCDLDWPEEPVEGVLSVMAREGGQIAIIGRSSAAAWAALESACRCWSRLFVEERGMIASGRLARGEVRSLVADYIDRVGVHGFFDRLKSMADAVLFDNRVVLAARGIWPNAGERFSADLLRWWEVTEPFLWALARAAAEAEIPVLMGGQSLVSGGLLALIDIQQRRRGGDEAHPLRVHG